MEPLFPLREKSAFRWQGLNLTHPGERDRVSGVRPEPWLGISRPSGSLIEVPLTEDELVRLISDASRVLAVLYKGRGTA